MNATVNHMSDNESDHARNTLADVVRIVGETRSDLKVLDRKVDRLEQKLDAFQQESRERFDQHDKRFDHHDKRFDHHDKRFDQLEHLIRRLLPEGD